jgi:hypothetical protein
MVRLDYFAVFYGFVGDELMAERIRCTDALLDPFFIMWFFFY